MLMLKLSIMLIFLGLLSAFLWSSSFLNILISFEIIMFSIYLMILLVFGLSTIVEILVFLVYVVSEAVLGLVILLLKLYFSGKDNMFFILS